MPLQSAFMAVVPVEIPNAHYDVTIQPGLLRGAGRAIQVRKAAVITDSNVASLHAPTLIDSLKSAGIESILVTLPAGEQHKTLAALLPAYDQILGSGFERSNGVIALGGGVVGDMAGFVAATILRGVPFVQIPTTLLAMVDASVGGKTGVDHARGKNLIGAFHQPIAVLIDPEVLKTLPPRELQNGLAECIKHEIIRDADGFVSLEKNIDRALALDIEYLTELIAHNVAIKTKVVAADPFEKGERAHLNFGHTFGHAIEAASNFSYSHGESVALGMCAAAHAAVELMMLDDASRKRIVELIRRAQLPTGGMKLPADHVIQAMASDKKRASSRLRFVLPDRIGHVVIRDDVAPGLVRAALETLRG